MILRNVTAIAQTEEGNAIHLLGSYGAELTVDAANVIARSDNDTDVAAEVEGGSSPKAHLNISNSDFGEFADDAPDAAVTALGTAGNIGAAPTFVDAAGGDFHVSGGSPTLDGGIGDAFVGNLDLDGHDRFQAGCFGANPVPDMGAYERTPTDACPPPPPPPPPPFEPRKPVFRILSLVLNKKTGTGRLLVEVPGAGDALADRQRRQAGPADGARRRRRDHAADPDLGDHQGAAGETGQDQGAAEGDLRRQDRGRQGMVERRAPPQEDHLSPPGRRAPQRLRIALAAHDGRSASPPPASRTGPASSRSSRACRPGSSSTARRSTATWRGASSATAAAAG